MQKIKYIMLLLIGTLFVGGAYAQKTDRDYVRKGNKLYKDSLFVKAEVEYRKALDLNPKSTEAIYNLGNSLLMQQKAQEAMEQYTAASNIEIDKQRLAQIYHNMGVLLQAGKQYQQCIEAYKNALRNNSKDHETRYNLALAQKMLKDQQQQQNQDQDKDDQDQQQEQQQDQQQEQKQDERNQDKNQEQQNQDQQQNDKENKNKEQEQQQSSNNDNQMSKENAQQLLNAVMQDEKDIQDKIKKQLQQVQQRKFDKDW